MSLVELQSNHLVAELWFEMFSYSLQLKSKVLQPFDLFSFYGHLGKLCPWYMVVHC